MTRVGPQVPHGAALCLCSSRKPGSRRPNVFAKRWLLTGSFQASVCSRLPTRVSTIQSSTRPGTRTSRRSAVRAEEKKKEERRAVEKPSGVPTHGGDLNEGTSQSGAFARRVLRNVTKSCKAFVQLVTTDDCRTADVQRGLTCIAVVSQKKGFFLHFPILRSQCHFFFF